jgi:hypothetical protein
MVHYKWIEIINRIRGKARKTNTALFTKQVLQQRAEENKQLYSTATGANSSCCWKYIWRKPTDLRENFLEGLGSLYSPQMASYFQLINEEYGLEYGVLCQRILNKIPAGRN